MLMCNLSRNYTRQLVLTLKLLFRSAKQARRAGLICPRTGAALEEEEEEEADAAITKSPRNRQDSEEADIRGKTSAV